MALIVACMLTVESCKKEQEPPAAKVETPNPETAATAPASVETAATAISESRRSPPAQSTVKMLRAIWDGGSHMDQGHYSADGSQLMTYGARSAQVGTWLTTGRGEGRFKLPSRAIVLQAAFDRDLTRIVLVRNAERSDERISAAALTPRLE